MLLAGCNNTKFSESDEKLIDYLSIYIISEACGVNVDTASVSFAVDVTANILKISSSDLKTELESPSRISRIVGMIENDLTKVCVILESEVQPLYQQLYDQYGESK